MRKIMVQDREIEILDRADLSGNIFKIKYKDNGEETCIHNSFIKFVEEKKEVNVKEFELEKMRIEVKAAELLVDAKKIMIKCEQGGLFGTMLCIDDIVKLNEKMSKVMVEQDELIKKMLENLK
jgi:hypothetical protein